MSALRDLALRIAAEDKALRTLINNNLQNLNTLSTTAKTNLVAAVNELYSSLQSKLNSSVVGTANGVASLDATAKVPASQLRPSSVSYTAATGTFNFTWADGSTQSIDTPIETLFQAGNYNSSTKVVTFTLNSGNTVTLDLADLVDLPEIVVATANPSGSPTTGQRLYLRSDTGDYWINSGSTWAGPFFNLTAAERTKLSGIASGATANATDAQLRDRTTHTGTQAASTISDFAEAVDDRVDALILPGTGITKSYNDAANTLTFSTPAATTTTPGHLSAADKTKLDGISAGATANSSDAVLLNRANHTGTQPFSTITGTVPEAQIASEITRDSELTAAIAPLATQTQLSTAIAAIVPSGSDGNLLQRISDGISAIAGIIYSVGSNLLTLPAGIRIRPSANSASAIRVESATGTEVFTIDTIGRAATITGNSGSVSVNSSSQIAQTIPQSASYIAYTFLSPGDTWGRAGFGYDANNRTALVLGSGSAARDTSIAYIATGRIGIFSGSNLRLAANSRSAELWLPTYATHAAADAALLTGDTYLLTGDRTVYRRP